MGVLLQPKYLSALQLQYEAAADHFGTFNGLDNMLAQPLAVKVSGMDVV